VELEQRIAELEGALHELRAEGQQMHDDNLTLREQRRESRELLERAAEWFRLNDKAPKLWAEIRTHLSGEGK